MTFIDNIKLIIDSLFKPIATDVNNFLIFILVINFVIIIIDYLFTPNKTITCPEDKKDERK